MINLNQRSEMDNYYLLKKLPEYTHIKETGKDIPKDNKYYTSKQNDNQWNNKYRFSRKYLQNYHDNNDSIGKDKRNHLQQLEYSKQESMKQQQIAAVNYLRNEAIDRLHERKMERINVQLESQQQIFCINEKNLKDLSIQNNETKESRMMKKTKQSAHYLTGRAPTLWNELHQTAQKHLNLSYNEIIIEKDTIAVETIQKRIEKDQEDDTLRNSLVKMNMNKIRNAFKERSLQNYEFQQKVLEKRTSPLPNPPTRSVLEINRVRSKSYLHPELVEQQRLDTLHKKQYQDFLREEKEYLQQVNVSYEADKNKYHQNQLQNSFIASSATKQNILKSQNSNPTTINGSQQNSFQTFDAVTSNSDILNNYHQTESQINNQKSFAYQNNNNNNLAYSPNYLEMNTNDVNKINQMSNSKQKYHTSNATPSIRQTNSFHSNTSQAFHQFSQVNMNDILVNEQYNNDRIRNQSVITKIQQISEKPLNLNELQNTKDLNEEAQTQKVKLQQNNKLTPLKSSLKSRSCSQNNQDSIMIQKDMNNSQMMIENAYNPINEIIPSEIATSKDNQQVQSHDDGQKDSQLSILNYTSAKKVNFNQQNSLLEYSAKPPTIDEQLPNHQKLQNKDSFQINEQEFSIDLKSYSRNGTNQNYSTQSESINTTSNFLLKYIKTPIIHKQNSHLNDLSQPKSDKSPPKFTDKIEYRGLLSGEIDKLDSKLNNSFVKTMFSQSQIVRDQTLNSSAFRTTSQTRKRNNSSIKSGSSFTDYEQGSISKQNYSYYSIAPDPVRQSYEVAFEKFEDDYSTSEVRRNFPGKSLNEYRSKVKEFQQIKEKDNLIELKQKKKLTIPSISPQKSLNQSRIHPSFNKTQTQNHYILQ